MHTKHLDPWTHNQAIVVAVIGLLVNGVSVLIPEALKIAHVTVEVHPCTAYTS